MSDMGEIEVDLSGGHWPEDRTRVGSLAGVVVETTDAGKTYRYYPFDEDPKWARGTDWAKQRILEGDTSVSGLLAPAKILAPDGTLLEGRARQRVVHRLLGRYHAMPPLYDPTALGEETRAYVPGLWVHGTTPALVGPKGWGKTRLLSQLPAALIIPGLRLFDYFEPVEMTERERERDVWMINPETRAPAVHEGLLRAGLLFGYRDGHPCYHADLPDWMDRGVLIVEHIKGRASVFDLTNEAKRDWWEERLVEYTDRRMPPLTLIVDGVTAIVGNDTTRYGRFASALTELQASAEIPNGLGVLHSPMGAKVDTPMNGVESSGLWDGQWLASADRYPVEPATPRYFRTLPREGDPSVPRRRVVLNDELLRFVRVDDDEPRQTAPHGTDATRSALRALLRKAGAAWTWTTALCGRGDVYTANKKGLEAMERDGEVVSRYHTEGRTRGYQWRLADVDESADGE